MTAELVRGQNHPLPGTRVQVRITAAAAVLAAAVLVDEAGRLAGPGALAHPGGPETAGISFPTGSGAGGDGADLLVAVDLGALPATVHRVGVLLALRPGAGPVRFGGLVAPRAAVGAPEEPAAAAYTITGLDAETAVVALELYRRQDAWKARAVGQGYVDGLAALLADHGLAQAEAAPLAARLHEGAAAAAPGSGAAPAATLPADSAGTPSATAPTLASAEGPQTVGRIDYAHPRRASVTPAAGTPTGPGAGPGTDPAPATATRPAPAPGAPPPQDGPARPVAGDAVGWTMEERLWNQVWGMFEDLARAVAAYRSAVEFADSRRDRELDEALSDPRARVGGTADAARDDVLARREALVRQAREALDRDLAQLAAESEVVEPALPAALARWDGPQWRAYEPPAEPPDAVRLGDLHLPEAPALRIPLLARLPLERGLWIDNGRTGSEAAMAMDTDDLRRLALDTAAALALRLVAAHPRGSFGVHAIDPAGAGAAALAPLAGLLAEPPAAGADGVTAVLAELTRRVDLLQMARRSDDYEVLPPGLDTSRRLLIVHDFPHGFDDRAVTQLRYLADEGPAVGVHLLLVADRDEAAAYGPLLDPLWRSLLRLSPVPDDHLSDPWVGHAWTYEPLRIAPWDAQDVLARITSGGSAPRPR
ncbi:TerD family protein [Streptomyces sp. NPDC093225]|uniref:TerD family protein n=1 Tax=Streptomyces sp. NPDC093225 TaxID=3366034 RepID=UPI00382C41E9